MCGLDNRMLMAEKKAAAEDLGFVGEITSVNTAVINDAVEKGYIPVISLSPEAITGKPITSTPMWRPPALRLSWGQ